MIAATSKKLISATLGFIVVYTIQLCLLQGQRAEAQSWFQECSASGSNAYCVECVETGGWWFCGQGWYPAGYSAGVCQTQGPTYCFSSSVPCGSKRDCADPNTILGKCATTYATFCKTTSRP